MKNEKVLKLIHELNDVLCACSGFSEKLLSIEDRSYQKKILNANSKAITNLGILLENTRVELLREIKMKTIK
jgi:hypothetical protein